MAIRNWFALRAQSYKANSKTVTATYTARVGSVANHFAYDNPIIVVNPAADVTVTIPDGYYVGQTLYIVLNGNTSSKTLTVTCTTGTDYSTSTSGQWTLMVWTGAVAGWAKCAGTMS